MWRRSWVFKIACRLIIYKVGLGRIFCNIFFLFLGGDIVENEFFLKISIIKFVCRLVGCVYFLIFGY